MADAAAFENPLTRASVKSWLVEIEQSLIADTDFGEIEDWTLDNPGSSFLGALEKMAAWLLEHPQSGILLESEEDLCAVIQVLAYTQFDRCLRMINLVANRQPGFAGDLTLLLKAILQTPEEETITQLKRHISVAEAHALMERLRIVYRTRMYPIIFGPERRKAVLHALEKAKKIQEDEDI